MEALSSDETTSFVIGFWCRSGPTTTSFWSEETVLIEGIPSIWESLVNF